MCGVTGGVEGEVTLAPPRGRGALYRATLFELSQRHENRKAARAAAGSAVGGGYTRHVHQGAASEYYVALVRPQLHCAARDRRVSVRKCLGRTRCNDLRPAPKRQISAVSLKS